MNLLFPLGLAALASLLVPLLVHLARRTEQRPTDFAALRWLRQKPRPRHRPRFDERLLLATRLLLLAGIALVLAEPVLMREGGGGPVIAIAPGADVPQTTQARRIWLAPGFPSIDTPPPDGRVPATSSVASLVRQLDAELPPEAPLTVVVPRILDGADAERPMLSRAVTWRIADAGGRRGAISPAAPAPPAAPVLRYDPAQPGARYILAAVQALGGTDIGGLVTPLSPDTDRADADTQRPVGHAEPTAKSGVATAPTGGIAAASVIWLGAGALPAALTAHIATGRTLLVGREATIPAAPTVPVWRDAGGAALVEAQPLGNGRILRFTRALTPAALPQLLEPDFPRRLAALFAPDPAPGRVAAAAYAPETGGRAPTPPARPLSAWLALAVAVLFLVERWLATRSRRAPAP